jgi:hypothetical protein
VLPNGFQRGFWITSRTHDLNTISARNTAAKASAINASPSITAVDIDDMIPETFLRRLVCAWNSSRLFNV